MFAAPFVQSPANNSPGDTSPRSSNAVSAPIKMAAPAAAGGGVMMGGGGGAHVATAAELGIFGGSNSAPANANMLHQQQQQQQQPSYFFGSASIVDPLFHQQQYQHQHQMGGGSSNTQQVRLKSRGEDLVWTAFVVGASFRLGPFLRFVTFFGVAVFVAIVGVSVAFTVGFFVVYFYSYWALHSLGLTSHTVCTENDLICNKVENCYYTNFPRSNSSNFLCATVSLDVQTIVAVSQQRDKDLLSLIEILYYIAFIASRCRLRACLHHVTKLCAIIHTTFQPN